MTKKEVEKLGFDFVNAAKLIEITGKIVGMDKIEKVCKIESNNCQYVFIYDDLDQDFIQNCFVRDTVITINIRFYGRIVRNGVKND